LKDASRARSLIRVPLSTSLAGLLVTPLDLSSTFELFGSAVAALAQLVALEAWRTRPQVGHARAAGPAGTEQGASAGPGEPTGCCHGHDGLPEPRP
jgi:hypothetical protein